MLPFQIKICGITRPHDAIDAIELGADAIGLNFYPPSPRCVDVRTARSIVDSITSIPTQQKTSPTIVGVFVNTEIPEMVDLAEMLNLDAIQLHGDEPPEWARLIPKILISRSIECDVIRVIRAQPSDSAASTEQNTIDYLNAEINQWSESGAAAFLLDAAAPGEFGGTGKTLDWDSVSKLDEGLPIVLAGGLTPQNIGDAIRQSRVRSIDVASGVETSPGIKDPAKMRAFIEAAKQAWSR